MNLMERAMEEEEVALKTQFPAKERIVEPEDVERKKKVGQNPTWQPHCCLLNVLEYESFATPNGRNDHRKTS